MDDFKVQISDLDYETILTGLGYPTISKEAIEAIISKENIINFVVKRALITFNQFFPRVLNIQIPVAGATNLGNFDLSGEEYSKVFGILQYSLLSSSHTQTNSGLMSAGSFYLNPYYSASQVLSAGGTSYSQYGTPMPYGRENNIYQEKFMVNALESMNKAYYVKYDPSKKNLEYKSTIAGVLNVNLATVQNDINSLDYRRKQSFLNFCIGSLQLQVVKTLSLGSSDLPVNIDVDNLKESGEAIIQREEGYWIESSTFAAMR